MTSNWGRWAPFFFAALVSLIWGIQFARGFPPKDKLQIVEGKVSFVDWRDSKHKSFSFKLEGIDQEFIYTRSYPNFDSVVSALKTYERITVMYLPDSSNLKGYRRPWEIRWYGKTLVSYDEMHEYEINNRAIGLIVCLAFFAAALWWLWYYRN
ncbi:MAG TPA: hypothetical protein VEF04_12640 [Blastocatellia bacterium]|nr:hypothetical protein [Blastocatellia bacterium]